MAFIFVTFDVIFITCNNHKERVFVLLKGTSVNVLGYSLDLKKKYFSSFWDVIFFSVPLVSSIFQHCRRSSTQSTQIWSLTSCWRRLISCRWTSAVHRHSLTGETQDSSSLPLLSFSPIRSVPLSFWCLFLLRHHLLPMISGILSSVDRSGRRWDRNKIRRLKQSCVFYLMLRIGL